MSKLQKHSKLLVFIALIFFGSGVAISQDYFVAKTDNISNIQIPHDDLSAYFVSNMMKVKVQKMIIADENTNYFLMVKDELSSWIYVLELKDRKGKLYIKKNQTINACESNKLTPEVIKFVDGQVKGCVDCNHKVVKTQTVKLETQ